jgi:Rad3-related DNA helicase
MGGTIIKIDFDKGYMVLTNGKISWSVQFKNSIIYRKMSIEEIKQFYENELDMKDIKIKKYKSQIEKLQYAIIEQRKKYVLIKKLLKSSGIIKN